MGREGTTVQLEGLILFAGTCPPGLELIMASDGSNVAGHITQRPLLCAAGGSCSLGLLLDLAG
jgi:hypothetical protein